MDYPLIHPPFEIKKFEEMNRKEACIHFEWYMSEIPKRIALLKAAFEHTGGGSKDELDFSPESLVTIWAWFLPRIEAVKRSKADLEKEKAETPRWLHGYIEPIVPSRESDLLAVDIGIYLAETLRNHYERFEWTFKSSPKSYKFVNRPILLDQGKSGEAYFPAEFMSIQTLWAVKGDKNPGVLKKQIKYYGMMFDEYPDKRLR